MMPIHMDNGALKKLASAGAFASARDYDRFRSALLGIMVCYLDGPTLDYCIREAKKEPMVRALEKVEHP